MGAQSRKTLKSIVYLAGWATAATAALALATSNHSTKLAEARIGARPVFTAPEPSTIALADPTGPVIGDASLRGEIDLARLERRGDGYVVALADSRTATLTLDPTIQARAESVLEKSAAIEGAVVVMGLDGRVLALAGRRASKPKTRLATSGIRIWA